jgi:hypothetical protein
MTFGREKEINTDEQTEKQREQSYNGNCKLNSFLPNVQEDGGRHFETSSF